MESATAERRLSSGLVLLGMATLVGLLPFQAARWMAAFLPLGGAVVVLFAKPVGNRLMVFGLASLSGLLLVALWRFEVFFLMLTILTGVILVVAGMLKHRGTW